MRKVVKKLKVVDTIESTICNKCGGDCYGEGLPETYISGGWNSCILGDNNRYTFALCEDCLWGLFQTFEIKPVDHTDKDAIKYYDRWVKLRPKHTASMREDPNWLQEAKDFTNYTSTKEDEETVEFLKDSGYIKTTKKKGKK
jgi:hypothetical protein